MKPSMTIREALDRAGPRGSGTIAVEVKRVEGSGFVDLLLWLASDEHGGRPVLAQEWSHYVGPVGPVQAIARTMANLYALAGHSFYVSIEGRPQWYPEEGLRFCACGRPESDCDQSRAACPRRAK